MAATGIDFNEELLNLANAGPTGSEGPNGRLIRDAKFCIYYYKSRYIAWVFRTFKIITNNLFVLLRLIVNTCNN